MIVLDTHAWWWMVMTPEKLSKESKKAISSADRVCVAAASLMEIVMLQFKGRIIINTPLRNWFGIALEESGVHALDLDVATAIESYALPGEFHRDPADRQIVATARVHGVALISKDSRIRTYSHVETIW